MLKKRFSLLMVISALVFSLALAPVDTALAQFADGTYDVPYEMKEANSENTSIADGYFQKPAKVTVSGDNATVQFTVTSADMVQSISVPGSSVEVVSEGDDTRTYKFTTSVDKLKQPITMGMHIIVPEGTPGLEQGYDREHQARAVFDVSSISGGGSTPPDNSNKEENAENPKTGDDTPILLYTILLIGAGGGLILVRKLRPANE